MSLADVEYGLRSMFASKKGEAAADEAIVLCRPTVGRAFRASMLATAKEIETKDEREAWVAAAVAAGNRGEGIGKGGGGGSEGAAAAATISRREFRLLLLYLRRHFELLFAFEELEVGQEASRTMTTPDFEKAVGKLREWGVEMGDAAVEAALERLEYVAGEGKVKLGDLTDWALQTSLEAERVAAAEEAVQ